MAKAKLPAGALEFFREQGRKGGKLSGAARMAKLTPERRSEIAKKASAAAAKARSKKARKKAGKS
jgi:general stress protein YciG